MPSTPFPAALRAPVRALVERVLVGRLRREVARRPVPRHVGIIMDGNRRWARSVGVTDARFGHRAGADHLDDVLGWCADAGVKAASVYVLSADNLAKRSDDEVAFLLELLRTTIPERVSRPGGQWALEVSGTPDLLPDDVTRALKAAADTTRGRPLRLTLAVGYDPYREIVEAIRCVLDDAADHGLGALAAADLVSAESIDEHIASPRDDIDLVIRTSGEQRLSGFFPWRSANADLEFCDVYWPAFRELDLLRALRTWGRRHGA
ncbi:polyprenyl diphosphate synthase [Luteimicrobium sp. NPDC057192]|uniref:polyprenyl diphosphate synthase n=1 Tax=Luteimicrobium sp. NPDC057192 TaxID=3346042 RepID=UPI00362B27F4